MEKLYYLLSPHTFPLQEILKIEANRVPLNGKCVQLTNLLKETYNLTNIFIQLFSLSDNNSGGQRTAGDVLNDIGSMLADLTDELDAMLHMDPNQAGGGGNGSAAAGFSKA